MDDDELNGIFDNLTPEDLTGVPFRTFVATNIHAIRVAFLGSDGGLNPVAVLGTPQRDWLYAPGDDETFGEYLERLRTESARLGATRFFIARKTLVGAKEIEPDMADIADAEQLQRGIEQGLVSEGVFFFALRNEGGLREQQHGIMKPEPGCHLGEIVWGSPDQMAQYFTSIIA